MQQGVFFFLFWICHLCHVLFSCSFLLSSTTCATEQVYHMSGLLLIWGLLIRVLLMNILSIVLCFHTHNSNHLLFLCSTSSSSSPLLSKMTVVAVITAFSSSHLSTGDCLSILLFSPCLEQKRHAVTVMLEKNKRICEKYRARLWN